MCWKLIEPSWLRSNNFWNSPCTFYLGLQNDNGNTDSRSFEVVKLILFFKYKLAPLHFFGDDLALKLIFEYIFFHLDKHNEMKAFVNGECPFLYSTFIEMLTLNIIN